MYTDNDEIAGRSHNTSIYNVLSAEREKHYANAPQPTEVELQRLAAWNSTRQSYPRHMCVQQLVALQAAAMPDAIALVAGNQALSYKELNSRANQLAHYLQARGVRPNMLVGLCVERSLDMVIGLLGILKAGGAYIPLDPAYPSERLSFMLKDAQTSVLVTQQNLVSRLASAGTQVVCLDADVPALARQNVADPDTASMVDDLAYVIYTSGSTGQPKGALITHDSLLNLVFWHQHAFSVTSSDRATQVASPAFDATGWELWPYLTIGASVYLPDDETRIVPTLLRNWLVNCGITISFLPTPLAESVMTLEWPATTSLRLLLTGGDKLQHYPPAALPFALVNNYGPTEATVVATFGSVLPTMHTDESPSIGRPIANTQVYVLDEYQRQVPIGVPGELYIGGAGLAQGYLNRPELTAEKFIPHPFSSEPGTRLYKTGDLVRFQQNGQIMFMGRTDDQIKIRGYRIEPDEIVCMLNRHHAVQTSVVIAREDTAGDKYLVAYLVLVPGEQVTTSALRELSGTRLPDYMIPTTFVVLETLPLTPNGKVDRRALPVPDANNIICDEVVAVPCTPIEERVAGIVCKLLQLEQVQIDDNFFMLGGHSLLGTQIIALVSETFGINLSLRSLFDAPTVRLLSAEIERRIVASLETLNDDEAQLLLEQRHNV